MSAVNGIPVILHHTLTDTRSPSLLYAGEPAVGVGPTTTKIWVGDGTVNRLLLSTNTADNPLLHALPRGGTQWQVLRRTAGDYGAVWDVAGARGNTNTVLTGFNPTATGTGNAVMGVEAFHTATSGANNVVIGNAAMRWFNTGSNNVAIGVEALWGGSSPSSNVVIGRSALFSMTGGGGTVAIGQNAGRYLADGTTGNGSSTNSIFIGTGARSTTTQTHTNQIVIGANAIGHGANTIRLGDTSITQLYCSGRLNASGASLGSPMGPAVSGSGHVNISGQYYRNGIALTDIPEPTASGNFLRTGTGTWIPGVPEPDAEGQWLRTGSGAWQRGLPIEGSVREIHLTSFSGEWGTPRMFFNGWGSWLTLYSGGHWHLGAVPYTMSVGGHNHGGADITTWEFGLGNITTGQAVGTPFLVFNPEGRARFNRSMQVGHTIGPPVLDPNDGVINVSGGYLVNGRPIATQTDYQTTEQDARQQWIDGRNIYQTTIILPDLPGAGPGVTPGGMAVDLQSQGIANVGDIVGIEGTIGAEWAHYVPLNGRFPGSDLTFWATANRWTLQVGYSPAYGGATAWITMRYTKGWVEQGYTLFGPDTPIGPHSDDDIPYTLGVKFRAAMDGVITAIRFFRASLNTGPHAGILWSNDGTQLASVTFTDTATGWVQADFPTPVTISADEIYIASYHTPSGYVATTNFFLNDFVNGPLTAPSSASVGGNGVFAEGISPAFPTMEWMAGNYFVDVVFQPEN